MVRFGLIKINRSAITVLTGELMKNYLYYFEFFCGEYESYFFQQVRAENERDAIIEVVSFFINCEKKKAENYLKENLGGRWSVKKFWEKMDLRFHNEDWFAAYTLISLQEIDFDLLNI